MIYTLFASDNFISKADNFNTAWMSIIQPHLEVKFAPFGMKDFTEHDIVITYMDNENPYGAYHVLPSMKKIIIVGELYAGNIDCLKDVDYCIYTNHIQKKIADMYGIKTPCSVLPNMPLPITYVDYTKVSRVFLGGLLTSEKLDGFYSRILNLHKEYPSELPFYIMGVSDSSTFDEYTESLTHWLMDSKINGNRTVHLEFKLRYNRLFQLNLGSSSDMYLWKNEPSYDDVVKLINADNLDDVLKIKLGCSTQLPLARTYNVNIRKENCFSLHESFHSENFTMFDFGTLIKQIVGGL